MLQAALERKYIIALMIIKAWSSICLHAPESSMLYFIPFLFGAFPTGFPWPY